MDALAIIKQLIQEFNTNGASFSIKHIKPDELELITLFKPKISRIKFNTKRWLEALKNKLGTNCAVCGAIPILGHHILPVELYPELAENIDNGIILCLSCHQKVHKMLKHKGFNSRSDYDQFFLGKKSDIVEGYTVEELSELSGYSVKTIYNLTAYGCLPSPNRGIDTSKYKSKGLYAKSTLDKLYRFTELKNCGRHNKARIICIMKNELLEESAICQ
jgi:hypothetical protein